MEETNKHTLLIVDDEKNILSAIRRLLRNEDYDIVMAGSAAEGFEVLKEHNIQVIISDQRMPGMNGTDFLSRVKDEFPDIIRIILSGYTDIDSMAEAINRGHIYKFLLKPWNDQNLILEIRQAFDQYDLIEANKILQQKILIQNKKLKVINDSLEKLVKDRTRELEIKNHALELSQAVLNDVPVPVLGVTLDGMIALVNRAAVELKVVNGPFVVGNSILMYFDEGVASCIEDALRESVSTTVRCAAESCAAEIVITPLCGRFIGRGKIITFVK